MKYALAVLVALVATLASAVASAHDVRGEVLSLDVGEHVVAAELDVPVTQLRAVAPELFPGVDHDVASLDLGGVPPLVARGLRATTRDGRAFTTYVDGVHRARVHDSDMVVADVRLVAPDGASARWLTLRDDVILGRLVTDSVYVFLRRDLRADSESPVLLGEMHYQQLSLVVDRSADGASAVIAHAFRLGIHHIAEGSDHVLFLLMLILSVPLASAWRGAVHTAKIVTGFTVGHSVTLALASGLAFRLGARASAAVEILIAVSILVTAVHAIRPIFPRREPFVAAAFGLVHGLAFASALAPFGFDRTSLGLALFGFNLGVEAMQLAIVVATVPLLAILARGSFYRSLKLLGASFGALASIGWILERAFGVREPTGAWVDALVKHGPAVIGALAVMAVVDALARRRSEVRL